MLDGLHWAVDNAPIDVCGKNISKHVEDQATHVFSRSGRYARVKPRVAANGGPTMVAVGSPRSGKQKLSSRFLSEATRAPGEKCANDVEPANRDAWPEAHDNLACNVQRAEARKRVRTVG